MIEALGNAVLGLQKTSANVAKSADNIADPKKNDSIVEDIIDIKINANNFEANALVVATAKELEEALYRPLDIEV